MLWQEVKLRCGRKELEKGSVEACKQEQDQIRREKKKATVSKPRDRCIFTP